MTRPCKWLQNHQHRRSVAIFPYPPQSKELVSWRKCSTRSPVPLGQVRREDIAYVGVNPSIEAMEGTTRNQKGRIMPQEVPGLGIRGRCNSIGVTISVSQSKVGLGVLISYRGVEQLHKSLLAVTCFQMEHMLASTVAFSRLQVRLIATAGGWLQAVHKKHMQARY